MRCASQHPSFEFERATIYHPHYKHKLWQNNNKFTRCFHKAKLVLHSPYKRKRNLPRKFIIAKLSIRKLSSSPVLMMIEIRAYTHRKLCNVKFTCGFYKTTPISLSLLIKKRITKKFCQGSHITDLYECN